MEVDLAREIADLNEEGVLEGVRRLRQEGVDPLAIVSALQEGMDAVGKRFQRREYFLSELVRSAEIFTSAMSLLSDCFKLESVTALGTLVLGTVRGDIHDIGKNLVSMIMSANGFRVHDLGVDVPPDAFARAVKEYRPEFVGMSCLLTTSIESMKLTVARLEEEGLRGSVTVLVGGGPVDRTVCEYVRADHFCTSAQEAVELCKRLVASRSS